MKKLNLTYFTAARSDFGIMKNIILQAQKDKRFKLKLLVGSAHTSNIFGLTVDEIKILGIHNKEFFNFKYSKSTEKHILQYFINTLIETKKFFSKHKPDCVLIMGDRYEMLAVALACLFYKIPIAHFCGGSETLGSVDNKFRYTISKFSAIHFLETNRHKKNLINNKINKNLHVVGAPALEELEFNNENKNKIKNKLIKELNIDKKKKIITTCFHPETTKDFKSNLKNLEIFIRFIKSLDENVILTYPNADEGFEKYIDFIKKRLKDSNNIKIVKNLGLRKYYALLNLSAIMIGNSSSGIIESASFNLPTINLGIRQKNRFAPKNVRHCPFNYKLMKNCYNKIINSKLKINNPYHKINCAKNALNIIYRILNKNKKILKK